MFLEMLFKKMDVESTFVERTVSYSVVFNQHLTFWMNKGISPTVYTQISQDNDFSKGIFKH